MYVGDGGGPVAPGVGGWFVGLVDGLVVGPGVGVILHRQSYTVALFSTMRSTPQSFVVDLVFHLTDDFELGPFNLINP